jgi:hypothetical protein
MHVHLAPTPRGWVRDPPRSGRAGKHRRGQLEAGNALGKTTSEDLDNQDAAGAQRQGSLLPGAVVPAWHGLCWHQHDAYKHDRRDVDAWRRGRDDPGHLSLGGTVRRDLARDLPGTRRPCRCPSPRRQRRLCRHRLHGAGSRSGRKRRQARQQRQRRPMGLGGYHLRSRLRRDRPGIASRNAPRRWQRSSGRQAPAPRYHLHLVRREHRGPAGRASVAWAIRRRGKRLPCAPGKLRPSTPAIRTQMRPHGKLEVLGLLARGPLQGRGRRGAFGT